MSLEDAWKGLSGVLKKQRQGTCGVYSLWYATELLAKLGGKKPIVYPRRGEMPKKATGESARHFAKQSASSGQGEVLSEAEMTLIVKHFGYTPTCYARQSTDKRKEFITEHLKADRPILVAYLMQNSPVTSTSATGTAQDDYGAHWSLIINEDATEYRYLEPNNPNKITTCNKDIMLASNADVDGVIYDRFWMKPSKNKLQRIGDVSWVSARFTAGFSTLYDLGSRDRQSLNYVLIAVS
ncbi:hypothetical protein VT84_04505 [Gemmata sp. SH-PL17]|uniref:hypothetical protein n=1 Tax=Gemmata sp. SH-PL17 TaxID=1630693 RepID=UPI0004AD4A02|nr:hypothetical protein [Gemmata sp. SH-PL17]AMV23649.1 hypothetical protein VT84_04505 [Gemmata sp. SH-PL17]